MAMIKGMTGVPEEASGPAAAEAEPLRTPTIFTGRIRKLTRSQRRLVLEIAYKLGRWVKKNLSFPDDMSEKDIYQSIVKIEHPHVNDPRVEAFVQGYRSAAKSEKRTWKA